MTSSLGSGARYLFKGFNALKHPRIMPFVIGPLIINIALFYFGISYLYDTFSGWLDQLLNAIPEWLAFIKWLLWPLFFGLVLLVVAYGFTFVAMLIGSPFYGLMAEQVEITFNGQPANIPLTVANLLAIVPRALVRELQKMSYYLRWLIPLALLSLLSLIVTPLATLMPAVWFLFGAWMLSIQYIDYNYDNHQIGAKKLREDLKQQRMTALGFGSAVTLASMIPLMNIIVIPAAVCGATIYWAEQLQGKQVKS